MGRKKLLPVEAAQLKKRADGPLLVSCLFNIICPPALARRGSRGCCCGARRRWNLHAAAGCAGAASGTMGCRWFASGSRRVAVRSFDGRGCGHGQRGERRGNAVGCPLGCTNAPEAQLVPAAVAVAAMCREQMLARLFFAVISLLDEVTRGGSDPQMHAYVLKSFEAAQVLLNTELRVGLAQQSNWLTTERYAQLKLAPARTSGTKGDPAAAALLTSASTWESFAVSIHRAMHQQPRGAQYWRRVGRSLT